MPWLKITGISLPWDSPSRDQALLSLIYTTLKNLDKESLNWKILKRSLDARKGTLRYVFTLAVEVPRGFRIPRGAKNIQALKEISYTFPAKGKQPENPPLIVGAGPAGLFCALILAEEGYQPILLEQGDPVETRKEKVRFFWEQGILDPQSNMQFGEGGAGTFSDGKLNTGIKDREGRMEKILRTFVDAGAPADILISNKPHIGTDYLEIAVQNIRKRIERLGGEVRFRNQVTGIFCEKGRIRGVEINGRESLPAETLVLALGHSARDTLEMLHQEKIPMEKKIFAVGLRIEHPQSLINLAQYGRPYRDHKDLPAADYKLAFKTKEGRGVYSFCMCPGGKVVASASEPEMCVTNGMSYYAREGRNANAALLVNVYPEDFDSPHLLAGMEFQRQLERKAFFLGGGDYSLPIQLLGDFRRKKVSSSFASVTPDTGGKTAFADLNELWPEIFSRSLLEGLDSFDRKIPGFAGENALLTGVESRSSSPLRILRDETGQSTLRGLFPCGEGAGYAGGIMSAAVDGIRIAEAVGTFFGDTGE